MCDISIPLTRKVEDCRPSPAALVATQLYSPAFSACTDSMLKVLSLLLTRLTTTPFPLSTVLPLKIQNIVKGKSPLLIEHEADVISPELNCSSPKSKGKICGGTGKKNHTKSNQIKNNTVHIQICGKIGNSGLVLCDTSIFSSVMSLY
jgi:hypothetical protein